jgi:hypothetical protein
LIDIINMLPKGSFPHAFSGHKYYEIPSKFQMGGGNKAWNKR